VFSLPRKWFAIGEERSYLALYYVKFIGWIAELPRQNSVNFHGLGS